MRRIPLKDVMEEKYAVYFMTAGTKPPQPHNGYCPHSHRDELAGYTFDPPPADVDPEETTASPPSQPPAELQRQPIVHSLSKGASWWIIDGQIVAQTH
eukprot:SAG11_NODE_4692_length_1803_cov_1.910798_3_plen_98_part_00